MAPGTWRGAAKGRRYEVRVVAFATLTNATWADIEAEAERVAHVRGHEAATVVDARGVDSPGLGRQRAVDIDPHEWGGN